MHGAIKRLRKLIGSEVIKSETPTACTGMAFPCIKDMPRVYEQVQIKKEAKRGQRRHHGQG